MNKNLKILWITYEDPFLRDNGDRIYTCNILDALLNFGYDIHLIGYYFQKSKSNNNEIKNTESTSINFTLIPFKKASKLKMIFSLAPGMIVNRKRKSFLDLLEINLKEHKYDCIFVNHFKMVFSLEIILKAKLRSKLIHVSHNAEYLLSLNNAKNSNSFLDKIIYWQDSLKTKFYENKWLNYFDIITTISEKDSDYYDDNFKNPSTCLIRPVFEIDNSISKSKKSINELIIVGSFIWGPKIENLLAFLNSKKFNALHANGIKLTIVGNADSSLVNKINSNYKGVFMTGKVESVKPYYDKSKIAIVPELLGGGFKLKVAEAALNKTAIFSVAGAITKSNFTAGKHFIEAKNFDKLIEEVIKYQQKESKIDSMIDETFKIAKNDFTSSKVSIQLENILKI